MNKRSIMFVLLMMAVSLTAVAGVWQGLGMEMDPIWILAGVVACTLGLLLLANYPAAFIIPFLFMPQYKPLPILSRFPETREFTALAATAILLGLAMALRLMRPSSGPGELGALLRGQWKGIRTYVMFAAIVAASYLYTSAPIYGEDKLLRFLTFGGLAFFSAFVLLQTEEDIRDFVVGTVLFALGVAAYSVLLARTGPSSASENPVHIGMGQLIGMAIVLLLYYPISDSRLRIASRFVCIPVLAVGLVSSLTRGPILGVVLVMGLSLVVSSLRPPWISRKMIALSLAAAAAAVLVIASGLFRGRAEARLQQKISELKEIATRSSAVQGSAVQRMTLYKDAIQAIRDRPILGWGVGGWIRFFNHTDFLDLPRPPEGHFKTGHVHYEHYPHNLFLEVGVEEGFVGLAALLIFLGGVFGALKENDHEVMIRFPFLLPVFIYLLFITQVSGEIVDNRFLWFWCGAVLVGCQISKTSWSEEPSLSEFPAAEAPGEASPAPEGI
jgi:O-antigen ligase